MQTGYPVMVVVVVVVVIIEATVQAATDSLVRIVVWLILKSAAFITTHRNNEMIKLIPSYFFRFLCQLTLISGLQTNAT
jgi:hypothetical protein